ncbi:hypothetical protein, partial [Paraburkholderia steynii]|uniref:hypothetical protein n=1 Tax=Paraburkholderia steynii TaxID=1245441 RepID=UPI001ABEA1F0
MRFEVFAAAVTVGFLGFWSLRWHPLYLLRGLRRGVFAFSLAYGLCVWASCAAVWFACVFAGVRALLLGFMRRRLICLRFPWHPRFAFVLHASPFDLLAFSLASA